MADNKKYYYMKLKDNFFDSDEMIVLESMTDGYLYSNILLKLYLRSLKDDGCLMFKSVIPYTPEILAKVTRHNHGVVDKAIQIFRQLGLVEILDNGAIFMLDIQNFIGESSTEADRKREYRSRIESEKGQMSRRLSTISPDKSTPEIEIEKKRKKDIKDTTLLDDFHLVKNEYEFLHKVAEMPYSNSMILEKLLKDGFTAETIIGIMKEKYKPNVRTLKFYEGAIRDTADHSASRRGRTNNTYYTPPSEREAQQAARMAKMHTDEYGLYSPVFDMEVD